ncbi:alpha/beta hydrolase-fold protein, partial [Bacillus thuringiensis]|nr:alpha/beta hydrolase-fold protein [Bacillus thuringiensis]
QYSNRFPSNDYPSGKIETYSFYSSILNNTRKIHIYTPHDYSHTSYLQELLIVFDGNSFINDLSITKTLNYLIYENGIPPCIAVDHVNQLEELTFENDIPRIENQISSINSNATQLHFYMVAGQLENKPLLTSNNQLYIALKDKGYKTTYEEFQDGHDSV